ncbi:uncharacterized protein T551_00084 [Pneumocystis jirovecii RU7]|uniref:Increased recombination centers protein 6 n=1 Tax=Pneumocystis jirovecii (strain RU7) TaxID=1408657 RepID=A0A0W4ZW53_PNEJ7|nr:uncharacterized protein T551_00084 [Pneumocystis jirovecii RU7]KTW32599.1 hypothetical protein T551_00084 [Pneumocystis jirovecii RU7]
MSSKKILLLGTPKSGKLTFLKELTGSLPKISSNKINHAGIIHQVKFDTKYYKATVDIWVDEFSDEEIDIWVESYLSEEAAPVREALGAIVIVFRETEKRPFYEHVLRQVKKIRQIVEACDSSWDGVLLAVKMPEKDLNTVSSNQIDHNALSDACLNENFEYVDFACQSTKQSKEGIDRVKEALEAFTWNEMYDLNKFSFDVSRQKIKSY